MSYFRRYIGIFFVSALVTLAALAAIKIGFVWWLWRQAPARLVDLHKIPPTIGLVATKLFIHRVVGQEPRPLILTLGDSQTFGISLSPEATFPERLAQRLLGRAVYNLGVIAGSPTDALRVLEIAAAAGIHAEVITYNINLTPMTNPEPRLGDQFSALMFMRGLNDMNLQTLAVAMTQPSRGAEVVTRDSPSLRHPPDWGGPSDAEIKALIAAAGRISRRQIFYTAPYPMTALMANGADAKIISAAAQVMDACRRTGGDGTICVDLHAAVPDDGFFDISHLNNRGARIMAEIMENLISTGSTTAR